MTVHVTWQGVLEVVGGVVLLVLFVRLLMFLWIVWRWGK